MRIHLFPTPRAKNENVGGKIPVFHLFSLVFHIVIILMQIFGKLPQISGLRPIVKICPDPQKLTPSKKRTASTEQILHALLQYLGINFMFQPFKTVSRKFLKMLIKFSNLVTFLIVDNFPSNF